MGEKSPMPSSRRPAAAAVAAKVLEDGYSSAEEMDHSVTVVSSALQDILGDDDDEEQDDAVDAVVLDDHNDHLDDDELAVNQEHQARLERMREQRRKMHKKYSGDKASALRGNKFGPEGHSPADGEAARPHEQQEPVQQPRQEESQPEGEAAHAHEPNEDEVNTTAVAAIVVDDGLDDQPAPVDDSHRHERKPSKSKKQKKKKMKKDSAKRKHATLPSPKRKSSVKKKHNKSLRGGRQRTGTKDDLALSSHLRVAASGEDKARRRSEDPTSSMSARDRRLKYDRYARRNNNNNHSDDDDDDDDDLSDGMDHKHNREPPRRTRDDPRRRSTGSTRRSRSLTKRRTSSSSQRANHRRASSHSRSRSRNSSRGSVRSFTSRTLTQSASVDTYSRRLSQKPANSRGSYATVQLSSSTSKRKIKKKKQHQASPSPHLIRTYKKRTASSESDTMSGLSDQIQSNPFIFGAAADDSSGTTPFLDPSKGSSGEAGKRPALMDTPVLNAVVEPGMLPPGADTTSTTTKKKKKRSSRKKSVNKNKKSSTKKNNKKPSNKKNNKKKSKKLTQSKLQLDPLNTENSEENGDDITRRLAAGRVRQSSISSTTSVASSAAYQASAKLLRNARSPTSQSSTHSDQQLLNRSNTAQHPYVQHRRNLPSASTLTVATPRRESERLLSQVMDPTKPVSPMEHAVAVSHVIDARLKTIEQERLSAMQQASWLGPFRYLAYITGLVQTPICTGCADSLLFSFRMTYAVLSRVFGWLIWLLLLWRVVREVTDPHHGVGSGEPATAIGVVGLGIVVLASIHYGYSLLNRRQLLTRTIRALHEQVNTWKYDERIDRLPDSRRLNSKLIQAGVPVNTELAGPDTVQSDDVVATFVFRTISEHVLVVLCTSIGLWMWYIDDQALLGSDVRVPTESPSSSPSLVDAAMEDAVGTQGWQVMMLVTTWLALLVPLTTLAAGSLVFHVLGKRSKLLLDKIDVVRKHNIEFPPVSLLFWAKELSQMAQHARRCVYRFVYLTIAACSIFCVATFGDMYSSAESYMAHVSVLLPMALLLLACAYIYAVADKMERYLFTLVMRMQSLPSLSADDNEHGKGHVGQQQPKQSPGAFLFNSGNIGKAARGGVEMTESALINDKQDNNMNKPAMLDWQNVRVMRHVNSQSGLNGGGVSMVKTTPYSISVVRSRRTSSDQSFTSSGSLSSIPPPPPLPTMGSESEKNSKASDGILRGSALEQFYYNRGSSQHLLRSSPSVLSADFSSHMKVFKSKYGADAQPRQHVALSKQSPGFALSQRFNDVKRKTLHKRQVSPIVEAVVSPPSSSRTAERRARRRKKRRAKRHAAGGDGSGSGSNSDSDMSLSLSDLSSSSDPTSSLTPEHADSASDRSGDDEDVDTRRRRSTGYNRDQERLQRQQMYRQQFFPNRTPNVLSTKRTINSGHKLAQSASTQSYQYNRTMDSPSRAASRQSNKSKKHAAAMTSSKSLHDMALASLGWDGNGNQTLPRSFQTSMSGSRRRPSSTTGMQSSMRRASRKGGQHHRSSSAHSHSKKKKKRKHKPSSVDAESRARFDGLNGGGMTRHDKKQKTTKKKSKKKKKKKPKAPKTPEFAANDIPRYPLSSATGGIVPVAGPGQRSRKAGSLKRGEFGFMDLDWDYQGSSSSAVPSDSAASARSSGDDDEAVANQNEVRLDVASNGRYLSAEHAVSRGNHKSKTANKKTKQSGRRKKKSKKQKQKKVNAVVASSGSENGSQNGSNVSGSNYSSHSSSAIIFAGLGPYYHGRGDSVGSVGGVSGSSAGSMTNLLNKGHRRTGSSNVSLSDRSVGVNSHETKRFWSNITHSNMVPSVENPHHHDVDGSWEIHELVPMAGSILLRMTLIVVAALVYLGARMMLQYPTCVRLYSDTRKDGGSGRCSSTSNWIRAVEGGLSEFALVAALPLVTCYFFLHVRQVRRYLLKWVVGVLALGFAAVLAVRMVLEDESNAWWFYGQYAFLLVLTLLCGLRISGRLRKFWFAKFMLVSMLLGASVIVCVTGIVLPEFRRLTSSASSSFVAGNGNSAVAADSDARRLFWLLCVYYPFRFFSVHLMRLPRLVWAKHLLQVHHRQRRVHSFGVLVIPAVVHMFTAVCGRFMLLQLHSFELQIVSSALLSVMEAVVRSSSPFSAFVAHSLLRDRSSGRNKAQESRKDPMTNHELYMHTISEGAAIVYAALATVAIARWYSGHASLSTSPLMLSDGQLLASMAIQWSIEFVCCVMYVLRVEDKHLQRNAFRLWEHYMRHHYYLKALVYSFLVTVALGLSHHIAVVVD